MYVVFIKNQFLRLISLFPGLPCRRKRRRVKIKKELNEFLFVIPTGFKPVTF